MPLGPYDHPNIYFQDDDRGEIRRFNALSQMRAEMRESDQACGKPARRPQRRCPCPCSDPSPPEPPKASLVAAPLQVLVRIVHPPVVTGGTDVAPILRDLEQRKASLEQAMSQALASEPSAHGQVALRVDFGPDGAATFARRQSGSLGNAAAELALTNHLRTLKLPSAVAPFAVSLGLRVGRVPA